MTCKCGQPVPESLVACDDKHIPKLCQDCFTSDILEPLRKERLALMFRVGQKDAEMKKLANIINPPSHKVPALYMCKCEVQGNWLDVHNHIQQENDYAKHYEHKIQVDGTWYDRDTKVVDITTKPAVRRSGTSNPRTPAAPKIGGLIRI